MGLVKYELEAPKEALDLGVALKTVLDETAKAIADGFQPGEDLVKIVSGSIGQLSIAISELQKIGEDFKTDPLKSSQVIANQVLLGVESLLAVKK
jgi:hypothetical protein